MSASWLSNKTPTISSWQDRLPKSTAPQAQHWLIKETPSEPPPAPKVEAPPIKLEEPPSAEALYQEALKQTERVKQATEAEYLRVVKSLQQLSEAAKKTTKPSAHDVVNLALLIAKEVVSSELTQKPEPLYAVVQEALQAFSQEKQVIIKANPQTLKKLLLLDKTLAEGPLSLVGDPSLQTAEVLIETPTQAISYRPIEQLEELREKIAALLIQREEPNA